MTVKRKKHHTAAPGGVRCDTRKAKLTVAALPCGCYDEPQWEKTSLDETNTRAARRTKSIKAYRREVKRKHKTSKSRVVS